MATAAELRTTTDLLEEALAAFSIADRAVRSAEKDASETILPKVEELRGAIDSLKTLFAATYAAAKTEEFYGAVYADAVAAELEG